MTIFSGELLKNKAFNGWNLFWLVSGPISIAMLIAMAGADLSGGAGVSAMIQLSVRCAVPWLYLTFAASSLHVLLPGPLTRWLLRNRKFFGLIFAAAMAWQGFFILWMVIIHSDYYINEVYVLRDAIEGVVGYIFLAAMTFTSFPFGRKLLSPRLWRYLHKAGIYFLWAYAFSVYWWALFYYPNPLPIDYIFYWGGFLAWAVRAAAWNKKRLRLAEKKTRENNAQPTFNLIGIAVVALGLIAAGFGSLWFDTAEEWLTGYAFTRVPELYLPYWPFQPYLPLFVIALGTLLMTRAKA